MLEMQGVIGRIQLKRMKQWTERRTKNAMAIWDACRKYSCIRVPIFDDHENSTLHAHYKCYVYVEPSQLLGGWTRDRLIDEINALGVPCYQGSCSEVYLEKAFENTGWRPKSRLLDAQELGESSLMFLVHPTLTEDDILKTCDAIRCVLAKASR